MWLFITLLVTAWLGSLIAAYLFGRNMHRIDRRISQLEEVIKSKVDKQPEPEKPVSSLIDPTDPIAEAIYEHEVMMKKLNGQDN